jgi:oxygen-dependent protoporphyrinogen oxidase
LAVVGGGISGLAAAHRLRRLLPRAEVHLFEATDRLGGPLHTLRTVDSILEQGADSFLIKTPWALELCRELGLAEQLVPVNEYHRRALVVHNGKLLPVPDGFVLMRPQNLKAMLRSPVLSVAGKLRLLAEPLIRAPAAAQDPDYDESVASFATRRLGREAFERLVQPLVAGIFVADAHRLSLAATFPEFLQAEREYGSLWRSAPASGEPGAGDEGSAYLDVAKPQAAARYGQFVSLRGGMSTLVEALRDSLPAGSIRLGTALEGLSRLGSGQWAVTTQTASQPEVFAGVILALPAASAARLVQSTDTSLAERLARIEYASSAVVTLVHRREQVTSALEGFGAVAPAVENRRIVAASFLNVKFPDWAPPDRAIIRVFMGGALRPEMVDRSDAELVAIATEEMAALVGAHGAPTETHVARWRDSMPQYQVGHLKLVAEIEQRVAAHPGLELAGSAYRGVGIPQCIRGGRAAAERLVEHLTRAAESAR